MTTVPSVADDVTGHAWVWERARPMLAQPNTHDLHSLAGRYVFDEKVDGVRALAAVGPRGFRLVNRNHVDRTERYPDLALTGQDLPDCVLDGEIVTLDESLGFEGIAKRDKQQSVSAVIRAAHDLPAKFVAFDVLRVADIDVRTTPYSQRRVLLEELMSNAPQNFRVSEISYLASFYDRLRNEGKEGVIAKLVTAPYVSGRSASWLKHKAKYRLTTIVVGYLPGTGKRKECGAFLLALLDEKGIPVPMGKVGSGFTDADIAEYKARLDDSKLWLAEIETMGLTDSGALRQPIFKGERTDLSLTDASTTQLNTLPKGTAP